MLKKGILLFVSVSLLLLFIEGVNAQQCNNDNICDSGETRASCSDCKMKMGYLTHIYDYSGGDPACMTLLLSDFKSDLDEYIRNTPGNQRTKYVAFNMNGWDIMTTTTRPDGYKGTYRFKDCPGGPSGCIAGTDWGGIYEDAIDYANSLGFTVVLLPTAFSSEIYTNPCPVAGSDTTSCVTAPDSVLEEEFYNWMVYLLNDRGYKNKNIIWHIGAEYDQFDYKGRWSSTIIAYRLDNILSRDPEYITSVTNLIKKTKDAVQFVGSNQLVTTASAGITGYLNPTYDPNTDDSIKQHLKFYGGADCTPTNLVGCNTGIGDVGVVDSVDIIGMDLFLPDNSITNTLVSFIQYMSSAFGKPLGIWQTNIYGDLADYINYPYETQRTSIQLLMDKYYESVIDYVTIYQMRDITWFDGNCAAISWSLGDDPEGIKYWDGKKKAAYDLYIDMFNKYGGIGAPITDYAMLLQYDYDTLASPICPAGYSQKGIFTPPSGSGYTAIDYQGTQTTNAQHQFCALNDNAFLALRYDYQTSTSYFCPVGYTDRGIFYPQSNPTQPTWTTAWGYDLANPTVYKMSSWAIMHLCSKDNSAFLNVRWDEYNKIGNSCPAGYYSAGAFKVPTQTQGSGWFVGYGYDPVTNSYPTDQLIEAGWMQLCVISSNSRNVACTQDYTAEASITCPNGLLFTGIDCSTSDYPSFLADSLDSAACSGVNDCVYSDICYPQNSYQVINGEKLFCNNNKWWDFDNRKLACEGSDICSVYNIGQPIMSWIKAGEMIGEYDDLINPECCGDDTDEYIITGSDTTIACCNSATDTVANGICGMLAGDKDASQSDCTTAGYNWISRGSQANCCGDDANEYYTVGTDLTSACCDSASASVEGGRCLLKKTPGPGPNYEDGWIRYTTSWSQKDMTGFGLENGRRIEDCNIFRSWMDFNLNDIEDNSYIYYDPQLTFNIRYSDNNPQRMLSIRKMNNGAQITNLAALASEIADGIEYTTYTPQDGIRPTNKELVTVELTGANSDLKNSLVSDSFSLGIKLKDETSCVIGITKAFISLDSLQNAEANKQPPYLTIYYNKCTDEDSDCSRCIAQSEKNAYGDAWLRGDTWQWPVNPTTISQEDVSYAYYRWLNGIGSCV